MSKHKKQLEIELITPDLKAKYLVSVEIKYLNKVKFFTKFVGWYFKQTNKKLDISFIGSKGYFDFLEFIAEGQEEDLEANKRGYFNKIRSEILQDENFIKKGYLDVFDTDKGIFFKMYSNKKKVK
jgi:hypothetical protein